MLNITFYQGNANQNYNKVPPHTEWPSLKSLQKQVLEKMWGKGNLTLLVGMYIDTVMMENSMEVPQKTKNRITILSSNLTPGHIT